MKTAIIDYGAGNLRSVTNALVHVAPQAEVVLATTPAQLADATHIILPGVGAFADCMRGLQSLPGMIPALEKRVREDGIPFLGICVGMQMLFTRGFEHGEHAGLNWIEGDVIALAPPDKNLKIPHMGWNELIFLNGAVTAPNPTASPPRACSVNMHALFKEINSGDPVYFVHSYHCAVQHSEDIIAVTDYGGTVTAAVAKGNILGVQFHPEKSQQTGLQLFRNFLEMRHHASPR